MTEALDAHIAPVAQALPDLPHDDDGPTFAEPWQAQAFAMAVRLHEQGYFTWTQWAEALSAQIGAAGPADTTEYYEHWLATLEVIVASNGLADNNELADRKEAWRMAAEATPHGQPILLSRSNTWAEDGSAPSSANS